jgi:tRNA (cmo5U34)-methyltransferase
MTIEQAFNATVDYYDDWMKKALPNYDDIFGAAVDLIPFDPAASLAVLDLGAGTGLFSQHVLEKYPQAHFVLYDLAEKMLAVAQERFRQRPLQFKYVTGDYRTFQLTQTFDVVISSLSIHHLADDEKAALFGAVYTRLRPGGVFINVDQIRGETAYVRDLYWQHWLAQVRRSGAPEARIRESMDRRTTYDRDATLADQLQWLRAASFENVDCVYKNFFVGVFLGCKA